MPQYYNCGTSPTSHFKAIESMTLRIAISTLLAAVSAVAGLSAPTTAAKAFSSAPRQVMPMLDTNTRLDMIDYFNSGMSTPSANNLNGSSVITALSPESVSIKLTDASRCQIAILPAAGDSVIAVITTVATPAPDSKMTLYTGDWSKNITAKSFSKPVLKDWLTPEGRKNIDEVESLVPFLLISYEYNPDNRTLTLTNNTAQFLSDDIYTIVSPFLLPAITYRWDGKKFVQQK